MATPKEKVFVAVAAVALVFGGLHYLEPKTPRELRDARLREQIEQLSDADETTRDRQRRDGDDLRDADSRDRLRPGERRPPELPHVRIRLP